MAATATRRFESMLDVAIIGAGLSGLSLADRLQRSRYRIGVFEARNRCGGRILSAPIGSDFAVDLGPTWLWPDHQPRIKALTQELGLELFRQWDSGHSLYQASVDSMPAVFADTETHAASRRIKGGCRKLVDGLLRRLPDTVFNLQHRLLRVSDRTTHVDLEFQTEYGPEHYQARQVVLAVPPRLLANSVVFEPELAPKLRKVMQDTPTWMAGHAKGVMVYEEAFWRRHGYSGNAILPYTGAVLAEIYDACCERGETAALFGFFGLSAPLREHYRRDLETLLARQMTELYGAIGANPQHIIIQDWSQETYTATEQDHIPPSCHPDYGHRFLQLDHWQDKLYFSGTETAATDGGYLEGALEASDRVFSALALQANQ